MKQQYDVVIIGSGISGLYAALQLDTRLSVLVLSKQEHLLNNSSLAQGGIAAVLNHEEDSTDLHFEDTVVAGKFHNNHEAVRTLVEEGPKDVRTLMSYGVEFDQINGKIHFTLEGGHSAPRILHHQDSTGFEMASRLTKQALKQSTLELVPGCTVCNLIKQEVFYLQVLQQEQLYTIATRFCILATGGIGQVYQYTTNSKVATGDGVMFAHQLGAVIKDLHYIQFHPTGFANTHAHETFLISEAVRGEGAYLLNSNYQRFLHRYDKRLELAPRDVVSQAMIQEQQRIGNSAFYLDATHFHVDKIQQHFPLIDQKLRTQAIDMSKDKIPVYPCQHYVMGGIQTNLNGCSTLENLYAIGECANTGAHGKNRLASNSLLEAVVFARRAAMHINHRFLQPAYQTPITFQDPFEHKKPTIPMAIDRSMIEEIHKIMQQAFFVIPNPVAITAGWDRVCVIKQQLEQLKKAGQHLSVVFVETYSVTVVAQLILQELLSSIEAK